MERKTFCSGLKIEGDEGSFRATISTLSVVDRDGDVTLPGAFRDGQLVKVAAWGHNWNVPAVGKGIIHADARRAWVDGQFNLATPAGREHYEVAKFLQEQQEWSYGFTIKRSHPGEFGGRAVRFLEEVDVHEASPVMVGAGIGTGTDFLKGGLSRRDRAELLAIKARCLRDDLRRLEGQERLAEELIAIRNKTFARMVSERYGRGGRRWP
jgi:hypothetical protein